MKRFIDKRPYVYTENYSCSKNVTIVFRIKNSQKRSFSIKTSFSWKTTSISYTCRLYGDVQFDLRHHISQNGRLWLGCPKSKISQNSVLKMIKKSWTSRIFHWICNSPKFNPNIFIPTFQSSSKLAISEKNHIYDEFSDISNSRGKSWSSGF